MDDFGRTLLHSSNLLFSQVGLALNATERNTDKQWYWWIYKPRYHDKSFSLWWKWLKELEKGNNENIEPRFGLHRHDPFLTLRDPCRVATHSLGTLI